MNYTNRTTLHRPRNPHTLTDRQQSAEFNYNRALSDYEGDPRYQSKKYQRAGMSSSKGTAYAGAADAGRAYASGIGNAYAGQMADAYSNANLQLDDAAQRSQFGYALSGLQEDAAQRSYMNQLQSQQNAMNFMGNMVSAFGGGGPSSLLSGLL